MASAPSRSTSRRMACKVTHAWGYLIGSRARQANNAWLLTLQLLPHTARQPMEAPHTQRLHSSGSRSAGGGAGRRAPILRMLPCSSHQLKRLGRTSMSVTSWSPSRRMGTTRGSNPAAWMDLRHVFWSMRGHSTYLGGCGDGQTVQEKRTLRGVWAGQVRRAAWRRVPGGRHSRRAGQAGACP